MSKIIGVCGHIASGKSLVCQILAELGAVIIDADQIARQVVEPNSEGASLIKANFGEKYFDTKGQLLRKELGALIFKDQQARHKLNQILHPLIRAKAQKQISEYQQQNKELIVYEAALLLDSNHHDIVDQIWLIKAAPELIYQRLSQRDKLSLEQAKARLASQKTSPNKDFLADIIIINDGDYQDLQSKVKNALALKIGVD